MQPMAHTGAGAAVKLAPSVEDFFASHPDGRLEVLLVLDTPQPDLSFMVGGTRPAPAVRMQEAQEADETMERVRALLEQNGIVSYNWLKGADSFVVTLDKSALAHMLTCEDIAEIVENARTQ